VNSGRAFPDEEPDQRIRPATPHAEGRRAGEPPLSATEFGDDEDRPPPRGPRKQDVEHLRLLSLFHFIAAGIIALFATIPVIHVIIGIGMLSGSFPAPKAGAPPPPPSFGWMFVIFGTLFIVFGWTLAICLLVAGRFLKQRRGYMFCLVTAGLACLFQPVGMVLGVFTFLVLLRPSVKILFGREDALTPRSSG
jgi:hypothetical protein